MPIRFRCPYCDKRYKVSDSYAGKKTKCRQCSKKLIVPDESVSPSVFAKQVGEESVSLDSFSVDADEFLPAILERDPATSHDESAQVELSANASPTVEPSLKEDSLYGDDEFEGTPTATPSKHGANSQFESDEHTNLSSQPEIISIEESDSISELPIDHVASSDPRGELIPYKSPTTQQSQIDVASDDSALNIPAPNFPPPNNLVASVNEESGFDQLRPFAAPKSDLGESEEGSAETDHHPAGVKVKFAALRHAYSKQFWFWRITIVFFAALIAVGVYLKQWWLLPIGFLCLPSLWMLLRYKRHIKSTLAGGTIVPGRIVCLKPPLVAFYSNISKNETPINVLQVQRAPIHKMTTGPASINQRITGVAAFCDRRKNEHHWTGFTPWLAACATTDQAEIKRTIQSCPNENWQQLELALDSFSDDLTPGTYRIYSDVDFVRATDRTRDEVHQVVAESFFGLSAADRWVQGELINPKTLQSASSNFGDVEPDQLIALIPKVVMGRKFSQGVVISEDGVHYRFNKQASESFSWSELVGAFAGEDALEIVLRDHRRIRLDMKNFRRKVAGAFDIALNRIANKNINALTTHDIASTNSARN